MDVIPPRQCERALRLFWEREEEVHRRPVARLLLDLGNVS